MYLWCSIIQADSTCDCALHKIIWHWRRSYSWALHAGLCGLHSNLRQHLSTNYHHPGFSFFRAFCDYLTSFVLYVCFIVSASLCTCTNADVADIIITVYYDIVDKFSMSFVIQQENTDVKGKSSYWWFAQVSCSYLHAGTFYLLYYLDSALDLETVISCKMSPIFTRSPAAFSHHNQSYLHHLFICMSLCAESKRYVWCWM